MAGFLCYEPTLLSSLIHEAKQFLRPISRKWGNRHGHSMASPHANVNTRRTCRYLVLSVTSAASSSHFDLFIESTKYLICVALIANPIFGFKGSDHGAVAGISIGVSCHQAF